MFGVNRGPGARRGVLGGLACRSTPYRPRFTLIGVPLVGFEPGRELGLSGRLLAEVCMGSWQDGTKLRVELWMARMGFDHRLSNAGAPQETVQATPPCEWCSAIGCTMRLHSLFL